MDDQKPTFLLYLLSVGKEHELVLRLHGPAPSDGELASWMREGAVHELHVSHHGEAETFTFVVNFAHVVAARIAPYSESRISSF